jgi:acetoin utilization deacetylase AcuC-like enzyme
MGFCLFNNAAVGIRHALDVLGLERVALVDFDAHHGNGSEDILAGDERVLMASTFQRDFYPFQGDVPRGPNMVNVGLPAGAAGEHLRRAVTDAWLPALDEFRPQLVFISAGFDGHLADDMSGLRWNEDDYAWVTREVAALSERHCGGKIVSCLEGGYHLFHLARSAAAHLRVLAGLD